MDQWPAGGPDGASGTRLAGARPPAPHTMQQTLLALAAVLAFSIFALTRHEDDAAMERRSISAHVERAAENLARARLSEISRLAFDEADIGTDRIRTTPSTLPLGADAGETSAADFDDIDDPMSHAAVVGTPDIRAVPVGGGTVELQVEVSARYVQPNDPGTVSAVPTLAKEIAVRVTEVLAPGQTTGRMPVQVTVRSVFTPSAMTVGI